MTIDPTQLEAFRAQLACNFRQIDDVFAECLEEAVTLLSAEGVRAWLEGGALICSTGRGVEPVLVWLEEAAEIAAAVGEASLEPMARATWRMARTPNAKAMVPFLQSLPEAARRLGSLELLEHYVELVMEMMERTTGSIHGFHTTFPSPGLPEFLKRSPQLLAELSLEGLRNWIDYGIRNYHNHPDRQRDYFSLQSADSRAVLQRERHGVLFADHERRLDLYLRAFWEDSEHLIPYSLAFDQLRKPMPYYDHLGIRVPDVYDDLPEVRGIDRYRAVLAHICAHRRWTEAIIADNYSPFQRVAIEHLEDCRVDTLAIRRYPGLRRLLLALHPKPEEDACDPEKESCIRHRLAMLSRAILDPDHGYRNPDLLEFARRFHDAMADGGESSTREMASIAISFIARTRRQSDLQPNIRFEDTEVEYRDDNRHMWKFIEEGDEEEAFDEKRKLEPDEEEHPGLPPRHYPEWDYHTKSYRPDWVSLYEALHPAGDPALIDRLLAKHAAIAKQLKRLLDMLKPQEYVRVRFQEEGSELDIDVAIRSLIDFRAGAEPDPRINMSHRTDGRNIAVSLLLDLSESLNDEVPGSGGHTILQLSQEAVSLLGWAVEQLGDPFAIAGFHSDTRHNVRYFHIKGYSEHWDDTVKARLAAMEAGYSTRMGAAMRHAGYYLAHQKADKKLLLVLTDGEPSDIDVNDERLLIEDARRAVIELDRDGIYTYCITLDRKADDYVGDIFGRNNYTVVDRVERLPEKLPLLFASLTS
ncbi:MAG TPA: VWA domain-containing protein [Thiotrichales bacterium]|nr:VWA domain-containing protein [Thiotrichales bacterium]